MKNQKTRERYLKHEKPCNPCGCNTHTHTHIAFLQNKEESNLINKIRVGVNSTLLVVNKKENVVLEN